MRERLRVSLEKNSALEEELNLTKDEVSTKAEISIINSLNNSISFIVQLQQIRSGAIQITNQNDGTKSIDGNKVSHHIKYVSKMHAK